MRLAITYQQSVIGRHSPAIGCRGFACVAGGRQSCDLTLVIRGSHPWEHYVRSLKARLYLA